MHDAVALPSAPDPDTVRYDEMRVLGTTGEDGVLRVSVGDLDHFLVKSADRLPVVIAVAAITQDSVPIRVELAKGAHLTVHVTDELGLPVGGARVEAAPHRLSRFLSVRSGGDGNALSEFPVWSRTTDVRGIVEFPCLPFGHLYVSAWHGSFVPNSMDDDSLHVHTENASKVSIVLKPLFGAVFECPSRDEVVATYWSVDGALEITGGHVIAAAARGRAELHERFPDCFVFAHRPELTKRDLLVGCWVLTSGGQVWSARWPLRPVAEILDPVFMEPVAGLQVRTVRPILVTPSQRRVPVSISLRHEEFGFGIEASSEASYRLPTGNYSVGLTRCARALITRFRKQQIEISATNPMGEELLIPIELEIVRLTLRASIEGRRGLGPAFVKVTPSEGKSYMVENWNPSDEHLDLFVPPGKTVMKIGSSAYEDAGIEMTAEDSGVIDVRLVQRRKKAGG
ncbi:MAG: hypothetical protein IT457_24050 [Planctomycetes bacterium]|nr:hypothetical protein [Planctomycetota bacterium]